MSVVISDSIAGARAFPPPEALLGAWAGSDALVYCRDWEGRILAANQAFARKFGCPQTDLAGRPVAAWLHQDDAPALVAADTELNQEPRRASCESRWLTPQGWRWIAWEEKAISEGNGWIGVRSVGHDITRQRVAEDQYFKLSRAVEQSPVAIAITDADGNVQYVNAKFTEATGYTLERLLDEDVQVLREGHPDENSYGQFWDTVRRGQEWRGELMREGPDGRKVFESVQVCCLRSPTGEVTNFLCLREDITGRKTAKARQQLRRRAFPDQLGDPIEVAVAQPHVMQRRLSRPHP